MNSVGPLLLYGTGVVLVSCLGGAIPLWSRSSAHRLELFLAASAGMMLGVVGGHMLPEAFEAAGPTVAWAVIAGFLFMLLVERFILPHALHAPHASEAHVGCDPAVEREHVRADAAGVGAFIGLTLHTLADGLALGAVLHDPQIAPYVFLAIAAHKLPTSFALGSILVRAGMRPVPVVGAAAAMGAMVAVGGALFLVVRSAAGFDPRLVAPYAVAFSAGSFLHVAVTDLLPDLHRRGSARTQLVLALIGGLALAVLVSFFGEEG